MPSPIVLLEWPWIFSNALCARLCLLFHSPDLDAFSFTYFKTARLLSACPCAMFVRLDSDSNPECSAAAAAAAAPFTFALEFGVNSPHRATVFRTVQTVRIRSAHFLPNFKTPAASRQAPHSIRQFRVQVRSPATTHHTLFSS